MIGVSNTWPPFATLRAGASSCWHRLCDRARHVLRPRPRRPRSHPRPSPRDRRRRPRRPDRAPHGGPDGRCLLRRYADAPHGDHRRGARRDRRDPAAEADRHGDRRRHHTRGHAAWRRRPGQPGCSGRSRCAWRPRPPGCARCAWRSRCGRRRAGGRRDPEACDERRRAHRRVRPHLPDDHGRRQGDGLLAAPRGRAARGQAHGHRDLPDRRAA